MNKRTMALVGLGVGAVGAGLLYLADPRQGRRRRARLRHAMTHTSRRVDWMNVLEHAFSVAVRAVR